MRDHSTRRRRSRRAVALLSVLYFLVVCALTSVAVLFAQRSAAKNAFAAAVGTQLIAAADAAAHGALANWDSGVRVRQPVGSTISITDVARAGVTTVTYVTRLGVSIFAIVAEARTPAGAARRVNILVRQPVDAPQPIAALVSAVNVSIGPDVRFTSDTLPCDDPASAAIVLAPSALFAADSAMPPIAQPSVRHDSIAEDSTTYLRRDDIWWSALVSRAAIRFTSAAHVTPTPTVVGTQCTGDDTNWGDPTDAASACANRVPLVYAAGDLTIDGGVGQGVLLVDGHLTIAGPFTYSGQIVARHGIESLGDNIRISGVVYAWRASADSAASRVNSSAVVLTHATTIRRSRCDAQHGIASSFEPRRVREHAWSELF